MRIRMRPYMGDDDKRSMTALVRSHPMGNVHVVDLPYRLASWALDYPENVGLWEDGDGNLLAWAVLQTPFWALDYAFVPHALEYGILPQILTWTLRRAREIAGRPNGRLYWYVAVFEDQAERIGDLERAGFSRVEGWSQVELALEPGDLPVELPEGFAIRPLAGEAEAEAYAELHRAAFNTTNMTAEWRLRTLLAPEYLGDVDLVAVAPAGSLAGFCICWLGHDAAGKPAGQIEPLGVHPDYHKHGLGRALLHCAISRLTAYGAETLLVQTDSYRDAAFGLYTSAGFVVRRRIVMFGQGFAAAGE